MTRVTLVCGVGGAGKTTVAAALALCRARQGERVVVLTIDPARRLADALGLGELGNDPTPVEFDGVSDGLLHAMMLDRKQSWDALVRRYSEHSETAESLLENRYYQAMSTRLTGSHEYMATEKLYELASSGDWDHVVVDTPPAQHALEFFRAPERVQRILDQRVLSAIVEPSGGLWGMASGGASRIAQRLLGEGVIADLREFFGLLSSLSSGLRERSAAVARLLASERCAVLLVTAPGGTRRTDAADFLAAIRERELHFCGIVLNRVAVERIAPNALKANDFPDPPADVAAEDWADAIDAVLALPVAAHEVVARHQQDAKELRSNHDVPVWIVEDVPGGVRSSQHLGGVAHALQPATEPQP